MGFQQTRIDCLQIFGSFQSVLNCLVFKALMKPAKVFYVLGMYNNNSRRPLAVRCKKHAPLSRELELGSERLAHLASLSLIQKQRFTWICLLSSLICQQSRGRHLILRNFHFKLETFGNNSGVIKGIDERGIDFKSI